MNTVYYLGKKVRRLGSKNGFTIAELIIVIVVIGILASVTIVGYGSWKNSTLSAAVKSDLNGVASAMEDYRNFNNGYPSSIPNTFTPSSSVTLTIDPSGSATSYCIDGVSDEDPTITFYVASSKKDQGAIQGTCADLTVVAIPSAPNNLVVTSFVGNSVSLSWDAVAGADNYTAQCAYDAAFINNLQQSTQSSTSTSLSGFTPSSIYCRAKAINDAGSSGWSPIISSDASLVNGLVAWYPFNGNAKDVTGNGNNGVVSGASLTYGIEGTTNSAYSFDGVNDYIELPSDELTSYGAFTISAWAKIVNGPSAANGIGYILHRSVDVSMGTSIYWIAAVTNGSLYYGGGASSYGTGGFSNVVADTSTWRLVTLTYDGNVERIYVDGSEKNSYTVGAVTNNSSNNKIGIGGTPHNPSYRPAKGSIDDVRIYNRALSASEVGGLYDAYAPQSTLNGLAGWWPLNGNVVDASGNGNSGSVSGATLTTGQNSQSNSAYAFNGLSQNVQLPATHNVSYGTVSLWVKPSPTQPTANYFIFSNPESGTNSRVYIRTNSDGTAIIGALGNGTTIASTSTTSNTWHHVVVTWSGTNSGMYLDGVNVTTASVFNGLTSRYATTFLGCINSNAECFSGSIDDVRVYDRVISSGEVSYLYGLGAK